MTNIVLIGCGKIAKLAHLPALRLLHGEGRLKLTGVSDLDAASAEATAREYNLAHFGADWRKVVEASSANAVAVILPPGPNAEVATEAARLGLHVICEKPPGRDLAQAEQLRAVARADRAQMIAFNRRYAPVYVQALERSRRLGMPRAFSAKFTRPAMNARPSDTMTDWITSDGSHALDLAMATIGLPHSISVSRHGAGSGPDNIWTIQLTSDDGGAVLVFGFAAGRRVERYEWIGPGYDVALDMPERGEWSQQGCEPEIIPAPSAEYHVNYGFVAEHRAFAEAIDGGERPRADFVYAASFMEVVQTILHSQPRARTMETKPVAAASPVVIKPSGKAVQILQPVSSSYFTVEQLTQLGRHCTLRRDGNLDDVNALVLGWGAPAVTTEQLAPAKNLQLVVVLGASVQWALPMPLLLERGVAICNTADAIAQSVAEHCLLLTLAGLRRLTEVDHGMRRGDWPPQSLRPFSAANLIKQARKLPLINALKPLLRPMASGVLAKAGSNGAAKWNDLQGQTVGLIGWGHIARHYAKLLQPFGCRLLVCSEHVSPAELAEFGATPAALGEVLGGAKVISLHKGLTEQSKGLLDESALALIPRGAVLVNTARAGLIDEAALIARARKGDMVFALDVFHQEPLARKHPLRGLENVILSPHNASSTPQCNQRVGAAAIQIVEDWLAGRPVPALNPARLAAMT